MTDRAQSSVAGNSEDGQVKEVLDKLDRELVGLQPVKTRIREIAALLLVDKLRKGMGLNSGPPSLHMSFTGNPGTGKTTVALRMAEILHRLGYIRRPEVVSVTRDDLVGQYIGHTAPKTKEVLKRAMGGVLFIDEAYYLYRPENERDYGQESIEILLQVMENNRDDLVVILAGYKDRMDTFFSSNPGISSRVAHHMDFPDFAADELAQITQLMLQQQQYRFSPEAEQAYDDYLQRRMQMPQFANARSIRNALDRARLRQANRLYAKGGTLTREELMTIDAEDILASRVFRESRPDGLKEEAKAEKKTSQSERQIDTPVARVPNAPREVVSEQHHAVQDNPIVKTAMNVNESDRLNSASSTAGFGGMPHTLPPAQSESRWSKRNQGASAARLAQPAPRREAWREPPKVVNGHCEFGQCETRQEDAEQTDTAQRAPAPYMKPMPLTGQVADSTTEGASGFGVPRESHMPRVVVRRGSNNLRKKAPRDRAPQPPPQINRAHPVVVNGRCEFGQCEVPPKVEETATTGGQIVTGNSVERNAKVTGSEPGSCKKITGTEYIGPDQYAALCASDPYIPPAKVGVTHTMGRAQRVTGTAVGTSTKMTGDEMGTRQRVTGVEYLSAESQTQLGAVTPGAPAPKVGATRTAKNKTVTGTQVGTSSKVTGDEPGSCKHVTGDEYLTPATADVPCASEQSPGPAKVNMSRTTHGRTVSGTLVGDSVKITGDEYGACTAVTGTEYAGLEQYQACNREPVPAPEKVGVMRTWLGQAVSGTPVEHSSKVTGDEYGGCQPISGTEYIGPDQYSAFCDADRQAASLALMASRGAQAGAAPSGTHVASGGGGKVTGAERGEALVLSGTPYAGPHQNVSQRGMNISQHPLARAPFDAPRQPLEVPPAARVQGDFSIVTPARTAQDSSLNRITGTASGAIGRITGPVNLAAGLVSGTPEFRYRDDAGRVAPVVMGQMQALEERPQADDIRRPPPEWVEKSGQATFAQEPRSRLTGDGREGGFAITGAAWRRNESVTGTEGASTRRNPTLRGDQRGVVMGAAQNKERARPEIPVSKITGSSGNAAKGSAITYSGGARG